MIKRCSFALAALAVSLTACNNNQQGASQPTTTPQGSAQSQDSAKPPAKKPLRVEDVDFSKSPGVIRPAAFGYYFGLTKEQITGAGIALENTYESDEGFFKARTASAPIPWDGAEFYALSFHNGKLLAVHAAGKDITNDSTGSEGKKKYQELLDSLTEKYGKPTTSGHIIGRELWKEADEFYQCLAYDGCGVWIDLWDGVDKKILIQLKGGGGRGKGYITIGYEAAPEWGAAVDAKDDKKRQDTKKGL